MTLEISHAVEAARDKKAEELLVLDLRGICDFTDYFVICHGSSDRQVSAIADAVEERIEKELGVRPRHVEGRRLAEWVLLDYIDFVVHVFLEDRRRFFGLERLWGDAPRVELAALPAAGPPQTPVRTVKRLRAGRRRPSAAR